MVGNHTTYGIDGQEIGQYNPTFVERTLILLPASAAIMSLEKLFYADGASWDPMQACLPGTRVTTLSMIVDWSRSLSAQNVLWLNGVAGCGKSAISHTVAQMLHECGLLASCFFFSRDSVSRNTPQLLFTTIARDIGKRHPGIAADISAALENEPGLASAPIYRQFDAFIAKPLHRHRIDHPLVVVIDALDESGSDADLTLLTIMCEHIGALPPQFRVFITSRSIAVFEQAFSRKSHILKHTLDIHSIESRHDIAAYVDSQLQADATHLHLGLTKMDEELVHELKLSAEGLFLWIATICAYLRSAYNPRAKLSALISKSERQGLPAIRKMDDLYTAILEACGDWQDSDFLEDYDIVMGAIMAAKRPLSLAALKDLHMGGQLESAFPKLLLERFGSVLVGYQDDQEPIRILHVSFREFITDRANNNRRTRKFYISEKEHSQRLAQLCLQTMLRGFKSGCIAGIGYLSREDSPPGIPQVTGVSEELLYGCDSWIDHIADIEAPSATVLQLVQDFQSHYTTVWIELVSSQSVFRGSMVVRRWLKVSCLSATNSYRKIGRSSFSYNRQDHGLESREMHEIKTQAAVLSSLSDRLLSVGRFKEGLTALQEAVNLYTDV